MKKFISLILAFAMLCTSLSVFATNEEETTEVVDLDVKVNVLDSEEYNALYAMGFLHDEVIGIDKDALITRAQFVGFLAKLSGYAISEYNAENIPFVDVNTLNPYCNEICSMYEMGYVSGMGDKIFNPNDAMPYAFAAKLIVDVLGYNQYVQIKYGDSLDGYVITAGELELNDKLSNMTADTPLTLDNAITLLYNAACTETMEFSGVNKNGNPIYTKSGKALLARSDIYQATGVMQSNGLCSLVEENVPEGRTIINGVSYASADADLTSLLGYKVKYFYKDCKTDQKLLWASPDSRFDNVLELDAIDLAITSPEYTETNFVYYKDNNKTDSVSVDAYADVIYNNSYYDVPTLDILKPKTGTMHLVDNNDDDIYDVVIIEEFYNVFVKTVTPTTRHIVDKYNRTISINKYDIAKIIKDGREITLEELNPGVLLSCVENKDKNKIYIYVMSETGEGVLNRTSEERNHKVYHFGDFQYRISNDLKSKIEDTNLSIVDAQIGKKYKYYIDMSGEIGEFKLTDNDKQYAFLMRAWNGEVDEDGVVYTRLLLTDGTKVTGITKKKLIIDGRKMASRELMSNPQITDDEGQFKPQVVMVSFDSEGYLSEIDFAVDNTANPVGFDSREFSLDSAKNTMNIRSGGGYIIADYKYTFDEQSVVFVKWTGIDLEEPYVVSNRSALISGQYKLHVYDSDEKLTAKVAYKEQNANDNWLTGRMIVDEVSYVYDDGQEVRSVSGYYANGYKTINEIKPGVFPEDLKRGDLIRISQYNNKATYVNRQMTAESFLSKTSLWLSGDTPDTKDILLFTPIYNVSTTGFSFLCPERWQEKYGNTFTLGIKGGYKLLVLIYNTKTDEIIQGDITDIYQLYQPKADGSLPNEDDTIMAYVKGDYGQLSEIVLVIN